MIRDRIGAESRARRWTLAARAARFVLAAPFVLGALLVLAAGLLYATAAVPVPPFRSTALAAGPTPSAVEVSASAAPSALPSAPSVAPSATPAIAGDPRSSGEGAGLVGAPLLAVGGMLVVGLLAAAGTLLYVRLTGGPRSG